MKKAIIFGITGQDGSYLSELLIGKGYEIHGVIRRSSSFNTQRIHHLFSDKKIYNKKLFLHYGDLTDSISVDDLIKIVNPDEIYNLGAQSHVKVSFEIPAYTANVDAIGTLSLLNAIKRNNKDIKFECVWKNCNLVPGTYSISITIKKIEGNLLSESYKNFLSFFIFDKESNIYHKDTLIYPEGHWQNA